MNRKFNKGFSLVELIVVIAIMAILVSVMAPSLMKQINDARYSKDKATINNVAEAVFNGIAEEETYDDMMRVADHLPFDIYLSEIYDLADDEGAIGYIFANEILDEIDGKVRLVSQGVRGKDGFRDKVVKIHIDEKLVVTVEAEGAAKEIKIVK